MATKPAQSDVALNLEEALDLIDKTMERVKSLYEQYFLGIQKQPPTFIHNDLERKLRDLAQVQIRNTALRYRYATLQQKFSSYNSYWRRTLRQIENGTYVRSLAKLGRKAVETGEDIPEEILRKMPKRMREAVRRDREQARAMAGRRKQPAGEQPDEAPPDDSGDFYQEFSKPAGKVDSRGAHLLDARDADLDLDKFFAQVEAEVDDEPTTSGPPPQPIPSAPAIQRAAVLGGMPRAQSPAMRGQTSPGTPAPFAPVDQDTESPQRTQPLRPVASGQRVLSPAIMPAPTPPAMRTQAMPSMRPSGQLAAPTPPQPGQPVQRPSGQLAAQTPPQPGQMQPPPQPGQMAGQPPPGQMAGQPPPQPRQLAAPQPGHPVQRPSGQLAAQTPPQPGHPVQRPSGHLAAQTPPQPGQPVQRPSGHLAAQTPPQPGQPVQRPSGQPAAQTRPSGHLAAQTPPQPGQPVQRPSGQLAAQTPPQPGQPVQRPSVPAPARTLAMPAVPMPQRFPSMPTPPAGVPLRANTPPPTEPVRTQPMPAIPRTPVSIPVIPPISPHAPSQGVRPNPIAPGSSQDKAVGVETMAGPFAREPSVEVPPRRARRDTDLDAPPTPTPRPAPMRPSQPAARPMPMHPTPTPPQRPSTAAVKPGPPPGMTTADVDSLYQKYVKAKEMVGEQTNAQTYGKLLNTINSQAPKIMEQYKAKGVDFSVVVKDNQVIIKAKPKP